MAAVAVSRAPTAPPCPGRPATEHGEASGTLLAVHGLGADVAASAISRLIALAAQLWCDADVVLAIGGGVAPAGAADDADRRTRARRALARCFIRPPDHPLPELRVRRLPGARAQSADPGRLERRLARRRAAHSLTVLDVGTLGGAYGSVAIARADRILWVIPASADGLDRARRKFAVTDPFHGGEVLIAVADPGEPASQRALRRLAAERCAPLILMPALPPAAPRHDPVALEACQVGLQAVLGVLDR